MNTAEIYDMRGRMITQHFFDELEKIAVLNPRQVVGRALQLRGQRQGVEAALGAGDYLTRGTPWMSAAQFGIRVPGTHGLGTQQFRAAQAARVREAAATAKANKVLDEGVVRDIGSRLGLMRKSRVNQAFDTLRSSRSGAERKAALEYIQEARKARGRLNAPDRGSPRGRLTSFLRGQQPVEASGPLLSGRAKAGLALGGAGLAAGGGLYAYNRANRNQGGYGGGY